MTFSARRPARLKKRKSNRPALTRPPAHRPRQKRPMGTRDAPRGKRILRGASSLSHPHHTRFGPFRPFRHFELSSRVVHQRADSTQQPLPVERRSRIGLLARDVIVAQQSSVSRQFIRRKRIGPHAVLDLIHAPQACRCCRPCRTDRASDFCPDSATGSRRFFCSPERRAATRRRNRRSRRALVRPARRPRPRRRRDRRRVSCRRIRRRSWRCG